MRSFPDTDIDPKILGWISEKKVRNVICIIRKFLKRGTSREIYPNVDFDMLFLPNFPEFAVDCFTISSNFVWKFSFHLPPFWKFKNTRSSGESSSFIRIILFRIYSNQMLLSSEHQPFYNHSYCVFFLNRFSCSYVQHVLKEFNMNVTESQTGVEGIFFCVFVC